MAKINYAQAINICDVLQNNLTNIEIEAISQDLPKIFEVEISGIMTNNQATYLDLIPQKHNITISDVLFFEYDFDWCAFHSYHNFSFKTKEIPTRYSYFNVLLNCSDYKKITDFKMILSDSTGIIMNFQSFSIKPITVFHLGILAKTDNEVWKFYPRFKGYTQDLNTLLNDKNSFLYQ